MVYVLGFVVVGVVGVLLLYVIAIYNGLVRLKNNVSKSWSNIDVLLKQRHDELPKLVETCKQYMKFEQETLEKVMKARAAVSEAQSSGNIQALGPAETKLRAGLGGLYAVAENYPDLKTNTTFQNLQTRISQLENGISDRRELYNESVNLNNTRLEQFPDSMIAKWGSFKMFEFLAFDSAETKDVNVKALFQ
jgi:LemA protein